MIVQTDLENNKHHNQAFQQIIEATGGENSFLQDKGWLAGLVFAFVAGSIIIGGIKSIGKVTEKLVPIMALIYILSCLFIIILVFLPKSYVFKENNTFICRNKKSKKKH